MCGFIQTVAIPTYVKIYRMYSHSNYIPKPQYSYFEEICCVRGRERRVMEGDRGEGDRGREGGREGGRDGGREGGREGGKGGRERG